MTQVPFYPRPAFFLAASALIMLALAAAGCGTANHHPAYDASAPVERPIAMKGTEKFFDGKIDVALTVSRGFGRNMGGGGPGTGSGNRGGYNHRDDEPPDLSEVFSSELNDSSEDKNYQEIYDKMRALQVRGSPLPPVSLRLFLHNLGTEAADVEILEVNSDLGNFAVKPDKLTLVTGQIGEPEPMNSLMGVTSDEIPVKVVLRTGGKTEAKTVLVKSVFTADGKKK
jgi:hypothetical protein